MALPTSATSISPPDIVLIPKTPTPPQSPTPFDTGTPIYSNSEAEKTHGRHGSYGLGLTSHSPLRHTSSLSSLQYDSGCLSPVKMNRRDSIFEDDETAINSTPNLSIEIGTARGHQEGPFNFQSTSMAKSPVIKSNISARRGHKYKHSSHHSISHAIFLEPSPTRTALSLPASLPMPTFKECRASMTFDQNIRFYWSLAHMAVAAHVAWNAHSSAAMEALSHLIFYDSLGALLCVFVEVWSNFEVWGRSSIRHPFGLQRMEVIAGFALSVLLIFFGFDLISHNAKHALEGLGTHVPHYTHAHHDRVSAGTVDFTVLLALGSTLISAVGLKNHARIGKAMRFAAMENLPLPAVLCNPSHFLTLSCSTLMLLLPLLELHTYEWVDKALSLSIAFSMLFLGAHLGRNVGGMLLMSYPGKSVQEVIRDIETDPLIKHVDVAKFWQAHYGVGIANLRLKVGDVSGEDGGLVRLRERIVGLIRNRLSGGYGGGSAGGGAGARKWEVSVEFVLDDKRESSAVSHSHSHGHGHTQFANVFQS